MPLSVKNIRTRKYSEWLKSVLVFIFSLVVAWFTYWTFFNNTVDELKNVQQQKLFTTASLFNRELGGLSDLLRQLANNRNLDTDIPSQALTQERLKLVRDYFIRFGNASPKIAQIRWLDHTGQEVVRVEFSAKRARVSPASELQNKQARYYFQQGMKVPAPNSYFSPIDLNVEYAQIVIPYEPTIRGTIQTSLKNQLFSGVLVVNYRLGSLFKSIKDLSVSQAHINIVNKHGFWLVNQQPDKEWGFMLNRPLLTLKNESPQLWQYLLQHPNGGDVIINNQLNSNAQLAVLGNTQADTPTNQLFLYATSDKQHLLLAKRRAWGFALSVFSILFLALLAVNWREYRYQSKLISLSLKLSREQQETKRINAALRENIAQQQLLQDELVEAQKLSSLGLLVAGVAHELNTPIGGAIISLSNADNANDNLRKEMEAGISKSQFSAGVESINSNLHLTKINLNKAAEHINRFKRLAIDRVDEEYRTCQLDEIVTDLIASLQPRLTKGKVVIAKDIDASISLVSRPGIISQVLENLIMNSYTHGFELGQSGLIEIKARINEQNQICVTVCDNGAGIPMDIQSTVFEPFVTSRRGKGNIGLGLYMVNQWVTKLLIGKLSFSSDPNSNHEFVTQFTILLPLSPNQICKT